MSQPPQPPPGQDPYQDPHQQGYQQYPQGPGYQQYPQGPGYQGQYGLAIASMVLGILWIYWVGSILALIFGYVARKQIRRNNQSGDGMAIAGIVLGWIGVGILVLVIGGLAVGGVSSTGSY